MSVTWIECIPENLDKFPSDDTEYHYILDSYNTESIARYPNREFFPYMWISLDGKELNNITAFSKKAVDVIFYKDKGEYEAVLKEENELLTASKALHITAAELLKEELEIIKELAPTTVVTDLLSLTILQVNLLEKLGYKVTKDGDFYYVSWEDADIWI